MAAVLTVHYRTLYDHYEHVRLTLRYDGGRAHSKARVLHLAPVGITTLGAVFRLPSSVLPALLTTPCGIEYRADQPPKSGHIFLAEHGVDVENPFINPRLLLILLPPNSWIHARDDAGTVRDFFPRRSTSKFSACVVDHTCFFADSKASSDVPLSLSICFNEEHLTNPPRDATNWTPGSGNFALVDVQGDSNFSLNVCDAAPECFELVVREAALLPSGDSKIVENEDAPELLQLLATPPPVLKVYFAMLGASTPLYSLHVRSGDSELTVRREKDLYRSHAVFFVDLAQLGGGAKCLELTPLHVVTKKPARPPVTWEPKHGLSVTLVESYDGLRPTSVADLSVIYHRFGNAEHRELWSLHVSSDDREFEVPALQLATPGVFEFDLSGCVFRNGATVRVQPLKRARVRVADGDDETKETAGHVIARDVAREWTVGGFTEPVVYFVQGESSTSAVPPSRDFVDAQRFLNVTYRRWDEYDYAGWELFAYEDLDDKRCSLSLTPNTPFEEKHHSGITFQIDRSKFGSGAEINIIPRVGGDLGVATDKPMRTWRAGDTISCTIVQGTCSLLRSIEDAKNHVLAQVMRDGFVEVNAPAPLAWFKPKAGSETAVAIESPGKKIVVEKVEQISPVQAHVFVRGNDFSNEDFLVENTTLKIGGFNPVPLRWTQHDDGDKYDYEGNLGAAYTAKCTKFRCFAPLADAVTVVLYSKPTGNDGRREIPMRRIPEGCWKATVNQNLEGWYYKLRADSENKLLFPGVEVIDPYSRCNTGHTGRGLIFGKESTVITDRPDIPPEQMIVYELHLRDVSIDPHSGIMLKGKYLGLTEQGTSLKGVGDDLVDEIWGQGEEGVPPLRKFSTGLDHIVQMGVTAVQLMPIQDFDNNEESEDYRWGYMPVHFNSPDGWYSSKTTDASRVREFKLLVDALHRVGLKVIMDVVYNHTAEDANERNLEARFSFNGLAPRYYYRTCGNTPHAHTGDRTCGRRPSNMPNCGACYSNGSGCGNEFRSESPMGRRFLLDSLRYWVNEYKVDGFRFDLLGLVDLETVTQAAAMLREIDPNIVLYGEPWCGGLTPIAQTVKGTQRDRGFGVFNNTLRDAIRGSPFGVEETFVMDGGRVDEVKRGLIGSIDEFASHPLESINYVECHDNYTLWDHFAFYINDRCDDIKFTDDDCRRMQKLAAVAVFTAQGVPFIQAGQEFCRTKQGCENSYEAPDEINGIKWRRKAKEWSVVRYHAGLVRLRRAHPELFALGDAAAVRKRAAFLQDIGIPVPERCIAFRLTGYRPGWCELVVCFNPTPEAKTFTLPGIEQDVVWLQVVDESHAGTTVLAGPIIRSVIVPGRAAAVLRKASEKERREARLHLRLASVTDVYSGSIGDDAILGYAVSLRNTRTPAEQTVHDELVASRERFMTTR